MRTLVFFILIGIINACQTSNSPQTNTMETEQNNDWELEAKSSYPLGTPIRIGLKNVSDESLTVLNPMELTIQKQMTDGDWKNLRLLYCPCGASCPPPPERLEIMTGERHKYTWRQQEEWCEDQSMGRPITQKETVKAGNYRILVNYIKAGKPKDTKTYTVNFMLR